MILDDNVYKLNWVFTNAFRKFLENEKRRDSVRSVDNHECIKETIDENRIALYLYRAGNVVEDIPKDLELMGVFYKDRNTFMFSKDVCKNEVPQEYLIQKDRTKIQDIIEANSVTIVEQEIMLNAIKVVLYLVRDVLLKWTPECISEKDKSIIEKMYAKGKKPLSDYEILDYIHRKHLKTLLNAKVSSEHISKMLRGDDTYIREIVNEIVLERGLIFEACTMKNRMSWLKDYIAEKGTTRSIRVLQALNQLTRDKRKSARITLDFGYKKIENIKIQIDEDGNFDFRIPMADVYAFQKQVKIITRAKKYTMELEDLVDFISVIRYSSVNIFSEPVTLKDNEVIINRLFDEDNKDKFEQELKDLVTKRKLDIMFLCADGDYVLTKVINRIVSEAYVQEAVDLIKVKYNLRKGYKNAIANKVQQGYLSEEKQQLYKRLEII